MKEFGARPYSLGEALALSDEQGYKEPTQHIDEQLSWEVCVKYEPRLLGLVRRIEAIKQKNFELRGKRKLRYRYAQECWYGYRGKPSIKEALCGIVGWDGDTEYEELRSAVAYDICYRKLFRMLSR